MRHDDVGRPGQKENLACDEPREMSSLLTIGDAQALNVVLHAFEYSITASLPVLIVLSSRYSSSVEFISLMGSETK